MKFYDTHTHVLREFYPEDQAEIIRGCRAEGIWLNNVGTDYENSKECVALAEEYGEGVYAVVGMHPEHFMPTADGSPVQEFPAEDFRALASRPGVVGIGECGLDYYRLQEWTSREQALQSQQPAFVAQINVAKELDKALVIHCRPTLDSDDAYEDALAILERERPGRFEIHSFTGSWGICQKFLALGGYVALNGIVTFDAAGVMAEVAEKIPLDRLLLETDAPFLAPIPFRGKRNQPQYITYSAEAIAEIRGMDAAEVGRITGANALKLFRPTR